MSELPAPHTWKAPHDPLCRQQHWEGGDCFDCRLIAKVRADERVKALFAASTVHRDEWADLRAKVEALEEHIVERGQLWVSRDDVLALIDGSSE